MADTAIITRRRWPRVLGWIVLAFILLLVISYFVVSSSAFFKGVVLPRVGQSLNAKVTVADASIHPFSGAVMHGVKVQTSWPTPILTAQEVRIAYNLAAILRGDYRIRDIAIVSPDIEIIVNPDGTSNLDPLTQNAAAKATAPPAGAKPSQPSKPSAVQRVELGQLTLSNATIRVVKNYAGGYRDLSELTNANLTLTNLANGRTGAFNLAANVMLDNHPPAPGTNAALQGAAVGNFLFALSQDLKPVTVTGKAHLDVQKAGGSMSDFAGFAAILNCDVTPTEIKQVALRLEKNGGDLGGLNLSGPFDMAKTEGHLKLEVTPVGRQALDLIGAGSGIDFGSTMLSSSNELDFSKGGELITVSGQFNANHMTLAREHQTTPALEVHSDYQLTVNRQNNSAVLQSFNLNGTQNQQPLLSANLASPMSFSFGQGGDSAMGDSTLKFVVTNLNLAEWKAILGNSAVTGAVNAALTLLSQQAGKQITVDFGSQLANLTASIGGNQIQQASLNLQGHLVRRQSDQSLTGNIALSNFNGRYENYAFKDYSAKMDLNVAMNKPELEIKNIAGHIFEGANPGGEFQLSGNYNQNDKTGQLALKLVNLNQNALRPFLGALLGDKTLVSVSVNSTMTAHYIAKGESSFKTDLQVANLVVRDPKTQTPTQPLEAKLQVDASLNKQIAQVHQLSISLTPTPRAANNQVTMTGQMDLSHKNAIEGSLKLVADSLDVTHYYDIFSKKSAANTAPAASAPAPVQTAAANTEPPAKKLPFKNFTFEANIGRVYLHEVEVANFQAKGRIDDNHVTLKPVQFTLNGGPVNAAVDLNLGVPGYQYNISFSGQTIPLAPLADTFSPQYSGNAKGQLSANLQINGAGTTGSSLQKNLSGQCNLALTNAEIKIVGPKIKAVLTPIAMALRLPELLQSPITWASANATIGSGTINLTQFKAAGSAFSANSQGTIAIAEVLSNSPIHNLPVDFGLSRAVATKARMAPSNEASNSAYVDLGKVATVSGTVGDPKTEVDYAAIGLITTRALGGAVLGAPGSILHNAGGLGGVFGGKGQSSTNQSNTNQSSGNPFDLFHKVLPK